MKTSLIHKGFEAVSEEQDDGGYDAVKLYELMMDGPYKSSVQDCSMLLRSIAASGKQDFGSDLVFRSSCKEIRVCGVYTLDLRLSSYDGIHRSLTSAGSFDEAENILKVMRNAGFEPDRKHYI